MLPFAVLSLIWSLASLAAAQSIPQCTLGEIVCCDAVQKADTVVGLPIGISISAAASLGLVGSSCTTDTVIGLGKSCATKQVPVCCTHNSHNETRLGCAYINPMFI